MSIGHWRVMGRLGVNGEPGGHWGLVALGSYWEDWRLLGVLVGYWEDWNGDWVLWGGTGRTGGWLLRILRGHWVT